VRDKRTANESAIHDNNFVSRLGCAILKFFDNFKQVTRSI